MGLLTPSQKMPDIFTKAIHNGDICTVYLGVSFGPFFSPLSRAGVN